MARKGLKRLGVPSEIAGIAPRVPMRKGEEKVRDGVRPSFAKKTRLEAKSQGEPAVLIISMPFYVLLKLRFLLLVLREVISHVCLPVIARSLFLSECPAGRQCLSRFRTPHVRFAAPAGRERALVSPGRKPQRSAARLKILFLNV